MSDIESKTNDFACDLHLLLPRPLHQKLAALGLKSGMGVNAIAVRMLLDEVVRREVINGGDRNADVQKWIKELQEAARETEKARHHELQSKVKRSPGGGRLIVPVGQADERSSV